MMTERSMLLIFVLQKDKLCLESQINTQTLDLTPDESPTLITLVTDKTININGCTDLCDSLFKQECEHFTYTLDKSMPVL